GAPSSARSASSPESSPGPAAFSSSSLALVRFHDHTPSGLIGRARGVLSSHATIYLERFHADRGTGGRRRGGSRPERQDHFGRRRRTAHGQGEQPRQSGAEEDGPQSRPR